jgi:hypothetical protein
MRSPLTDGVVRADDINRISVHGSQSYLEAKRLAPFDVVNLDFCEPVLSGGVSVYPLLDRLFNLQRTNDDWLLLLTSFVDAESSDDGQLIPLLDLLSEDTTTCEGLESVIAEQLGLSAPLTPGQARNLSPSAFFLLTSVLAGTRVLREAMRRGFRVKVVSVFGYSVHATTAPVMDMVSLSLRLQPDYTTVGDDAGLVGADDVDPCDARVSQATHMLGVENVDEYMTADGNRARYVRDSIALIRAANHPIEPYLAFLRSKGFDVPQ